MVDGRASLYSLSVQMLMGDSVGPRKEYITRNAADLEFDDLDL